MNQLLLVVALSLVCQMASAGGGDLFFIGIIKNKSQSHELSNHTLSSISIELEPFQVLPVRISVEKHNPLRLEVVSGCVVFVVDQNPNFLVCGKSASAPYYRGATYKYSGKRYLDVGARFTCIQGCNKLIPRIFKLMEFGTGED